MTTNPRIEAAARAICKTEGHDPDEIRGLSRYLRWVLYIPHATAALAAADAAAQPVAYAYVVNGDCEEIGWGKPPLDDPALVRLYPVPSPPQPDAEVG